VQKSGACKRQCDIRGKSLSMLDGIYGPCKTDETLKKIEVKLEGNRCKRFGFVLCLLPACSP